MIQKSFKKDMKKIRKTYKKDAARNHVAYCSDPPVQITCSHWVSLLQPTRTDTHMDHPPTLPVGPVGRVRIAWGRGAAPFGWGWRQSVGRPRGLAACLRSGLAAKPTGGHPSQTRGAGASMFVTYT